MNGKKCGIWGDTTSMAKRAFKLDGDYATEMECKQTCIDNVDCTAMSGSFGAWCIGCKGPLDADHAGTVAFKKQAPTPPEPLTRTEALQIVCGEHKFCVGW